MRVIWAVAKQTLGQCLRSKIAATFVVILLLILIFFPGLARGDGTLAGSIRTMLDYSLSGIAILLCIVTILLMIHIVSCDIQNLQIVAVVTKPLSKWQYMIGRWVGVVFFNAVLLAIAGVAIYGQAMRMRNMQVLNPEDRRAVESEIFVSRIKARPAWVDVHKDVEKRINQMKIDNVFEKAIDAYKAKLRCNREDAYKALVNEIAKSFITLKTSARPAEINLQGKLVANGELEWKFSGLEVHDEKVTGNGTVESFVILRDENVKLRITTDSSFIGRLQYKGPVQINGFEGEVRFLGKTIFDAVFRSDAVNSLWQGKVQKGMSVNLLAEPMIQIHYKLKSAGKPDNDTKTFRSQWVVTGGGETYRPIRNDPKNLMRTLTIPSRVIGPDGKMTLKYINWSPYSVTILPGNVYAMIPAGRFEVNFIKAVLLILLLIMFCAALGALAASFLGFAVGSVFCFSILLSALAINFLAESLGLDGQSSLPDSELVFVGGSIAYWFIRMLLPDISQALASGNLVDGEYISWVFLGKVAFWMFAVHSLLFLGLGCLIFQKREISKVQV